jgi:hypothetical protein
MAWERQILLDQPAQAEMAVDQPAAQPETQLPAAPLAAARVAASTGPSPPARRCLATLQSGKKMLKIPKLIRRSKASAKAANGRSVLQKIKSEGRLCLDYVLRQ